uniref:Uncharacterized protein n=1 Tax=Strigops habroptila TaxID=2489341 RepID=A0A672U089_STRHB
NSFVYGFLSDSSCIASCLMCSCCPTSRNSIVTRLLCSVFLLFSILIAIIMFAPLVDDLVNKAVTVHLNLCKYINCNKNSLVFLILCISNSQEAISLGEIILLAMS